MFLSHKALLFIQQPKAKTYTRQKHIAVNVTKWHNDLQTIVDGFNMKKKSVPLHRLAAILFGRR